MCVMSIDTFATRDVIASSRRAQASAAIASYWLRRAFDDNGRQN